MGTYRERYENLGFVMEAMENVKKTQVLRRNVLEMQVQNICVA